MTPEGWQHVCLEPFLDLLPGYAFKSSQFSNEPSDGLPLIRIRDLTSQSPDTFYQGDAPHQYLVESGTVLVGMDGDFDIRRWRGPKALLNQRVCRIASANPKDASTDYLYYLLDGQLAELHAAISGTTVKHLSTKHLNRLTVNLPPLPEQKKIAEILGRVDEAIQATQAVIDQTRKVKQGLLQQLLTRGIGHTRFKQTEIGEIPESWAACTIGDVCEVQLGKMLSQKARGGPSPKPYLGNSNVQWERIVTSELAQMDFSVREMDKFRLKEGDLLVCEGGEVGRAAIWRNEIPECYYQKALHRLRPLTPDVMPEFLLNYFILKFEVEKAFRGERAETTIAHLPRVRLMRLPVPIPPVREQQEVVRRLRAIAEVEMKCRDERDRLHRSKRGLMQDLLTGRVRVAA